MKVITDNNVYLTRTKFNFKSTQRPQTETKLQQDGFILSQSLSELEEQLLLSLSGKSKHNALLKYGKIPEYTSLLSLTSIINKPKEEIDYLYKLASMRDKFGQLRIPPEDINIFSKFSLYDLKKTKPLLTFQNDLGIWNYTPKQLLALSKLNEKTLYLATKLAQNNVNGNNILEIIQIKNINAERIIEKTKSLKTLYGKDLREIEFFTNRNGEKYLSADIQQPHNPNKPDWQNYKRVFVKLDDEINPAIKKNPPTQIDNETENIYTKIKEQLKTFSEKELNTVIKNLKNDIPTATDEEITTALQKLTQFANYDSLKFISQELTKQNIGKIHESSDLNACFKYFSKHKKILPLDEIINKKIAFFITKEYLNKPYAFFEISEAAENKDVVFINLESWSDGINLFSDDKKLEEKAKNILKKVKSAQNSNQELTFDEALSNILNADIKKAEKEYNITIKTISNDAPPTKSQILEQMQPIMPSKGLIKSTVESISNYFTEEKKSYTDLCSRIANYYQNNINAYSKQSIIENLKLTHKNIEIFLNKYNLPKENIYFIMPNTPWTHKSYEIITKMYTDLYNVSENNILRISSLSDLEDYPENSTFVILDDVVASGDSMLKVGDYLSSANELSDKQHILFAPITASQKGLDTIKSVIKQLNRENIDEIICQPENIKDYSDTKKLFLNSSVYKNKYAQSAFGNDGHGKNGMCTVFPYMDPDNNSSLAGYLTKFFVPNIDCLKSKNELNKTIEEKTYIYNIFGTDKEHISTDSKRAYTPTQNIFKKYIKNIFSI